MDNQEFMSRLEGVAKKLAGGKEAALASNPPAGQEKPEVDSKAHGSDPFETKEARFGDNSLAKCFLGLARADKQFHHLGADKVLENPRDYLRKRHGAEAGPLAGQYVVSDADLEAMIGTLLQRGQGKAGVPVVEFLSRGAGGYNAGAQVLDGAAQKGMFGQGGEMVRKALDTTVGGPLIRTDLDPLVYEAYLRDFPAAEVIRRIPANGKVHTYNQRTAPGTASTIGELGDMSGAATNSTYGQEQNSNISIIVSPRAIGLKARYAIQQSGMGYNVDGNDNLEIMGGLTAIANKNQSLMLQGNKTTAAKTLDDEEGLTGANDYDGLRTMLKDAGTSLTKAAGESYADAINRAVGQIMNAGGSVRNLLVLMSVGVRFQVNVEMQQFLRVNDRAPAGGLDTALSANGIVTLGEWLTRIMSVPAASQSQGLGYYTFGGNVVEDVDVIDPNGLAFAYLGSGTPVILELPIGFNNVLSQVYYPFLMNGLVCYIKAFHRKVRVPQQTI